MQTPKSDAAIAKFPDFMAEVLRRMNTAKPVYGDSSFERDPLEIICEAQEEIMDQCAWSYIAWMNLEDVKANLTKALSKRSESRAAGMPL